MTPSQRSILERLAGKPVLYTTVNDADWAVVVELGKAGLVKWPKDSGGMVSITKAGRDAIGLQRTEAA